MKNDPTYEETFAYAQPETLRIDIETPDPPVRTQSDEGAVAATLWDMFDSSNKNEPWDKMGVGLKKLWDVVADAHPDDLCDFYRAYIEFNGGVPIQS